MGKTVKAIEELVRRAKQKLEEVGIEFDAEYDDLETPEQEDRFDQVEDAVHCIICAIRGPDKYSVELKEFTVKRIRGILGMGTGLIRTEPLDENEITERNELLDGASTHFATHFKDALLALVFFEYEVPTAELCFG